MSIDARDDLRPFLIPSVYRIQAAHDARPEKKETLCEIRLNPIRRMRRNRKRTIVAIPHNKRYVVSQRQRNLVVAVHRQLRAAAGRHRSGNRMTDVNEAWAAHRRMLMEFVAKRVRDPMLADDIVQDVLVRAYERLGTLRQEAKLRSWLYQMTRNAIIDHYRKKTDRASAGRCDRRGPAVGGGEGTGRLSGAVAK